MPHDIATEVFRWLADFPLASNPGDFPKESEFGERRIPTSTAEDIMRDHPGTHWEHAAEIAWRRDRAALTAPGDFKRAEIGTFAVGYGGDLVVLREIPFDQLYLPEGYKEDASTELYRRWLEEGKDPLPGSGVINYDVQGGKVSVEQGHHRITAAKAAGRKGYPMWVTLTDPEHTARGIKADRAAELLEKFGLAGALAAGAVSPHASYSEARLSEVAGAFITGDCDIMALALHKLTGLPLGIIEAPYRDEQDGEIFHEACHACVVLDAERGVWADVNGIHHGLDGHPFVFTMTTIGPPVIRAVSFNELANHSPFTLCPIEDQLLVEAISIAKAFAPAKELLETALKDPRTMKTDPNSEFLEHFLPVLADPLKLEEFANVIDGVQVEPGEEEGDDTGEWMERIVTGVRMENGEVVFETEQNSPGWGIAPDTKCDYKWAEIPGEAREEIVRLARENISTGIDLHFPGETREFADAVAAIRHELSEHNRLREADCEHFRMTLHGNAGGMFVETISPSILSREHCRRFAADFVKGTPYEKTGWKGSLEIVVPVSGDAITVSTCVWQDTIPSYVRGGHLLLEPVVAAGELEAETLRLAEQAQATTFSVSFHCASEQGHGHYVAHFGDECAPAVCRARYEVAKAVAGDNLSVLENGGHAEVQVNLSDRSAKVSGFEPKGVRTVMRRAIPQKLEEAQAPDERPTLKV